MKQYHVARRLVELGAACGKPAGPRGRRFCLRPPGHRGACSDQFEKRRPTPEERLQRRLAKKSILAETRDRSEEHLRRLLRQRDEKIAWMSGYPLFRLEYRLRGGYRRLRRYYRFIRNRTWRRWRRPDPSPTEGTAA